MMKKLSMQAKVAIGIIVIGGAAILTEYLLVKWYPYYEGIRADKALKLLPYQNKDLGIEMKVAAVLYGKVEDFPGGVKIYRSPLFSKGPQLIITSQPNPDNSDTFSPQLLAKWETAGTYQNIPGYQFDHTKIEGRDAALIWRSSEHAPLLPAISFSSNVGSPDLLTAHIISPDHIVQANCKPGSSDNSLDMKACEESIKTIKVSGPMPKQKPLPGILELKNILPSNTTKSKRK